MLTAIAIFLGKMIASEVNPSCDIVKRVYVAINRSLLKGLSFFTVVKPSVRASLYNLKMFGKHVSSCNFFIHNATSQRLLQLLMASDPVLFVAKDNIERYSVCICDLATEKSSR